MIRFLIPLMLLLSVSACGKTGALYLPENEPAVTAEDAPLENSEKSKELGRGSF